MAGTTDTSPGSEFFEELMLCARYGDLTDLEQYFSGMPRDIVSIILQQQDAGGNTPLHFCSANDHRSVVKLFLSFQMDKIDIQNEGGNTALHWACLNGHLEVVKTLVDAGAGLKIKNKGGRMPIDEAENQGRESIVLWLLALDMKREKEAGVYNEETAEGESVEGDVNVNLTAGEVEAEAEAESVASPSADVDTKDSMEQNGISATTKGMDEMNMLD